MADDTSAIIIVKARVAEEIVGKTSDGHQQTHRREHLPLEPRDVVIPDVYQVVQLMDVKLIVLNDVSCSLAHLQPQDWIVSNDLETFESSFFSLACSYSMQNFQKSKRSVQETVENSLLNRGNSQLVHSEKIDHNRLVQLHQPLKDWAVKRRPPVS